MSDITNGGLSAGTLLQLEQMAEHGVTVEIERVVKRIHGDGLGSDIHQVIVTVTRDDEEVQVTRILTQGVDFAAKVGTAIDIAYLFTMRR